MVLVVFVKSTARSEIMKCMLNVLQSTKRCSCKVVSNRFYATSSTESETGVSETTSRTIPIITSRELDFQPKFRKPQQAWVENFDTVDEQKLGIIDLHPDVFGTQPRIDIIHANVEWQTKYKRVRYDHTKTRAEVRGGGRKPWPQKGLGKARHGSIRSPLWRGGGIAHGPRSPQSYFYMLPFFVRVHGLTSCLSVKQAQDDLHIVDSLDIPTDDPKYIEDLIESRNWEESVLIVDDTDIMPRNITAATDSISHVNLMPVYGLNVYSMMKHATLVLTIAAVKRIEEKLLFQMHRPDLKHVTKAFKMSQN